MGNLDVEQENKKNYKTRMKEGQKGYVREYTLFMYVHK